MEIEKIATHTSMIDYEKHTITSKNLIKRWIHKQRFVASLQLLHLEPNQRFLDYGCGDGELVLQAKKSCPFLEIVAFDPAEELYKQAVKKNNNLSNVTVTQSFNVDIGKFDKIACLETIEHLSEKELVKLFSNIKTVLKDEGFCLFSFPIEHGFISLFKNLYRMLTDRDKYVSAKRIFRSFLNLQVPREPDKKLGGCNYIYSHIGFDCRKMIKMIKQHFIIEKIYILPIGCITFGFGNSVAVIVKKKTYLT